MRLWLGLLLVASLAQAAPMQVAQAPVDLLHAERVDITERFEIVRVELAVALVGSTQLTNVEISELMTPAGTYVSRGHWTYSVTMREREADGIPIGTFDVRLEVNGEPMRVVRLVQNVSNPLLHEGARVTFDLGEELPAAPLFLITLREVIVGPSFDLTSAVDSSLLYVWRDEGQNENPTLHVASTDTVTFVLTNGDGTSPHNFQIQDGSDPIPRTDDMVDLGDSETLVWTPPGPGDFVYECQYHSTMRGIIEVTP